MQAVFSKSALGQVMTATTFALMTGGHQVTSPVPLDAGWVAGIVSFHSQALVLRAANLICKRKTTARKPQAGIEPASSTPDYGAALTIELPGHMCRSSPGGGGRARSSKKEGKQVARPSLELGSGLYRRAI